MIFKITSSDSQDSPVTSFEDNLTLSYEYKDADNYGIADEFLLNLSGIPAGGYYLLYRIDGKKDVIGI